MAKSIISIDMGGTKILASVINSNDGIIARLKKPTDVTSGEEKYLEDILSIIKDVEREADIDESEIEAVALGVPGSVNPETGIIGLAPNLGLKDFNIREKLSEKCKHPVLVENDVNLGALGIHNFGVGRNVKNMLVVFIGTGIGGGLIINNKIYRGSNNVAGEIGHIPVDETGPLCGCGRPGCFEAIASRTAIVNRIKQRLSNSYEESSLRELIKNGEKIKSKALANAVIENEKVVVEEISRACYLIGKVLAGLTNLMNFDMIVLGGGLIEALDDFMLVNIKESFARFVLRDSAKGLKLVASKLGDDAAIYGGIPLTKEFLKIEV